jgi:tetratricopeptide (TPR) repeat protein
VRIAVATVQQAASGGGVEAQAAGGVADLVGGDLDAAATALESAARARPRNSRFESDLAAAYLARAKARNDLQDAQRALDAADRALARDPRLFEALYNRALALETLGRSDDARTAWRQYVALEPDSQWRAEAQSKLNDASRPPR